MVGQRHYPLICAALVWLTTPATVAETFEVTTLGDCNNSCASTAVAMLGLVVTSTFAAPPESAVTCRVERLQTTAPVGWREMTFEKVLSNIHSCHTVRMSNKQLSGVLRITSVGLTDVPDDRPWDVATTSVEVNLLTAMGVEIGNEPLWRKASMPVNGNGFSDGKALGISAKTPLIEGPLELTLMLFRGQSVGYVVSLLTPTKTSKPSDHGINVTAIRNLMQSLMQSSRPPGVDEEPLSH